MSLKASSLVLSCLLFVAVVVLGPGGNVLSAPIPKTVAEVALYQGADREKVLLEGAKKEGQFTFYTAVAIMANEIPKAFEKKYPFIKVQVARAQGSDLLKRIMEENAAGRYTSDVIDTDDAVILIMQHEGLFQEYYTPEAAFYKDDVKFKGNTGVYYLGDRARYTSLGFNTDAISPATAPKTLQDLLDPKWKGKISIVSSSTGVQWIGSILDAMGRDYVEKLSRQDIKVHDIQGGALTTMIVSGEAPMSMSAGVSNIDQAKRSGAPVEWRALEPVLTNISFSGIMTKAPHPFTSMLFLDFLHSREAQQLLVDNFEYPTRMDISSSIKPFKKDYVGLRYPVDEYEKKFNEWQDVLKTLFIKKR